MPTTMELIHQGQQFLSARRLAEADPCFREALAQDPLNPQALHLLGLVVCHLGRYPEGIGLLERSIASAPHAGFLYGDLGECYRRVGQLDLARKNLRRALELSPGLAEAWHNLGLCLVEDLDYPGAVACYEKALALRPDYANAHGSLALALLTLGDFPRGFVEYEWRWRNPRFRSRRPAFTQPEWTGDDLRGRTLLVYAEQGFGDAIHFARFLPELVVRGGKVVCQVQAELTDVLATMSAAVRVLPATVPVPPFDTHIPLLSLPRVLGLTAPAIPAAQAYVRANPVLVEAWAGQVRAATLQAPSAALKVGLAYAGRADHPNDARRSCPPGVFATLGETSAVAFYSLQKDRPTSQVPLPMADLTAGLTDFAQTAALIANLDLVIAVDTAVAHLAAALGKPTWILLPYVSDWRWFLGRDTSPWYPTVRLFRQGQKDDWAGVIRAVAKALVAACRRYG